MCNCWGKKNITMQAVQKARWTAPNTVWPYIPSTRTSKVKQAAEEYQKWLRSINWMPQVVLPTTTE